MMREYPKHIKKLIRQYGAIAYDRELTRELRELLTQFEKWEKGSISSEYLNTMIYKFTSGPARQLYNRYSDSMLDSSIAYAIAHGILDADDLPDELLAHLDKAIRFYEERK